MSLSRFVFLLQPDAAAIQRDAAASERGWRRRFRLASRPLPVPRLRCGVLESGRAQASHDDETRGGVAPENGSAASQDGVTIQGSDIEDDIAPENTFLASQGVTARFQVKVFTETGVSQKESAELACGVRNATTDAA